MPKSYEGITAVVVKSENRESGFILGIPRWLSLSWVPAALGATGWIIISWVHLTTDVANLQSWRHEEIVPALQTIEQRLTARERESEKARWDIDSSKTTEAEDRHNIDVEGAQIRDLESKLRFVCEMRNLNCEGKR